MRSRFTFAKFHEIKWMIFHTGIVPYLSFPNGSSMNMVASQDL